MVVEKFPEIFHRGRRLIWDTRQTASSEPELVLIPDEGITAEARRALRARAPANFLGGLASGCDIQVADPRREFARLCSEALGHPSQRLTVLTVTGTNGKTTCAALVRQMLVQTGCYTAEIGTLGVQLWPARAERAEWQLESGFTTPEAPMLHYLFRQFLDRGVTHVVMESSSHALALARVGGVDFNGALFTNLSQDHLDFHPGMAEYEAAKARLFTDYLPERSGSAPKKKWAVINGADAAGRRIAAAIPASVPTEVFELGKSHHILRHDLQGLEISLPGGSTLRSPMVGEYNAENLVGAWALALPALTRDMRAPARAALEHFSGAPGRLERVPAAASGRFVFVDYAHTPDALEKVLGTLKKLKTERQKLWAVFGCGGDRDRGKRPLMGRIASEIADQVVLCSDNPRREAPEAILDDIEAGIALPQRSRVRREADRALAIAHALRSMKAGDVCVVAGKGHEQFQIVGTEKRPFDDRKVCAEILQNI